MQPPQTPLASSSRSLMTPRKTPFRTPLRTPGEQLSHTPVINFEAIEQHKENVQLLARGRSAHALTTALSQRHAELKAQRAEWEARVTSENNADADDPLEAWTQYVKWCVDSYPGGQTSESGLVLLLERCTRLFRDSAQYRNDSRYLRLWIQYARNVDCPADVYNFLLCNEIGTALASLYEELAAVYEAQGAHDKADESYRVGIHRSAQPIDRLKRRYKEYQGRVLSAEGRTADADRQTYKAALASALAKAQRSMLGSKTGFTSLSANTLRGQGVQAGLAQSTQAGNVKRPSLFKDADGDKSAAWSTGKPSGSWADIGTAASRKQERDPEARAWKGEVLPQRDASATPRRAAIPIYRDSDDEAEEVESPVKGKSADVFSKSSEPSDTEKLRRNPFLHYASDSNAQSACTSSSAVPQVAEVQGKAKRARQESEGRAVSSTKSARSKKEHYAVPVERLYPGTSIEQAGQRSSSKKRSQEVCIEEVFSSRYQAMMTPGNDPWTHLDALHGKWLPEIELKAPLSKAPRLVQRDPTVTAFTRAAQDEVLQMFNGGLDVSDEESSDEESESDEEDGRVALMSGDSAGAVHSPSASASPVQCEERREDRKADVGAPLSPRELTPGTHEDMPRRVERQHSFGVDDDDSREECDAHEDVHDYMNRPMCELAPLSPITEATEYTRTTQLSRTPGATTSSRLASRSWTTSSQRCVERVADVDDDVSQLEGDRSGLAADIDEAAHNHCDEEPGKNARSEQIVCPVDQGVIANILASLELPIESSADYIDCTHETSSKLKTLQKHAATVSKRRTSGHTIPLTTSPDWSLEVAGHNFRIRQKLGEGGYGAVFLAEDPSAVSGKQRVLGGINGDASFADLIDEEQDESLDALDPKLIAVKVESPPNRWEFYILGQLRARLTYQPERLGSIICARKFFCFQDESFLLLEYGDKGTLLEIVNNAISAGVASSSIMGLGSAAAGSAASSMPSTGVSNAVASSAVGIDEILAMFFTVELIKLVEALHAVDLLHGDLKIDNCLLRLDESETTWTHAYSRHGDNGWASRGITLIDFGRAVDLRRFASDQRFVADWTPETHDMPQIQRGESWRHEIDYFGIASIAYCLLFGKYIAVVPSAKAAEEYAIDRPLRRYWQIDIWNALFSLCLNCPQERVEAAARLENVRDRMETWLEANCFRAGKNLKGSLKKLEIWSMKRSG